MIVLVSLLTMLSSWSVAQVNVAPSATATASTCNTGACSTLNDLNFGSCGTQQMWISSSATNPGSSIFIQFTWPTVQVINKMTINVGQNNTRFLGGGTIQIWNGSAWVTHTTFTQSIGVCSYDINFNSVATTQLRIIDMVVIGSQSSNVNFREIQIWQGSLSTDDIGVASIDSPSVFCGGPQNIVARVQNFGTNVVANYDVNWSLNGVLQTPITSYVSLDTIGGSSPNSAQITLATGYTFATSTPTLIKAWTSGPNSSTDTIPVNDTASASKIPAMSGNFTINPLGTGTSNFTSFAAAISAMSVGGVCGPATFIVAPGTYTDQVVIPNIIGASPANPILFDGLSADSVLITGSFASQGTVIMNASKYITWRNMTVANTNTSTCAGIAMVGAVSKINISNCKVNLNILSGTSSTGYGIIATGTANGGGVSAMPGDSIVIDSNIVTGGGYGISIYGSSTAANNKGHMVRNNKVNNCNYMGGYIAYNYNPIVVTDNEFNMQGQNYGYYGLYFYYNQSNNATIPHQIKRNKIIRFGGYGIYLYYPINNAAAAPVECYNNVVSSTDGGSYPGYYGIYLYQASSTYRALVYHNTIAMNGS
ncbi:MAG: hypothetical protein K9H61_12080, partial [Bacteroidia bacterium]|nr:hypothetical protein [Bacteroidia bacterium]MCF8447725.1 hypothetical protein [Bacteroidia bacterium]